MKQNPQKTVHLAKHAHMTPQPHRPLLTSQENHVSDAFYKLLNSLTCQICLANQIKVLTEPCNHIVSGFIAKILIYDYNSWLVFIKLNLLCYNQSNNQF